MALFNFGKDKAETTQYILPFMYDENIDDLISDTISIEVAVMIADQKKYCYASYWVNHLHMEDLSLKLKNAPDKVAMIEIITQKGKEPKFNISLDSIAEFFGDERFTKLDLVAYGVNDRSYREMNFDIYE